MGFCIYGCEALDINRAKTLWHRPQSKVLLSPSVLSIFHTGSEYRQIFCSPVERLAVMKLDAWHVVRTGLLWFLSAISRVSDHDKSSLRQTQPIHCCLDDVVLLRVGLLSVCGVVPGPVFRVKAEAAGCGSFAELAQRTSSSPKAAPKFKHFSREASTLRRP